MGRMFIKCEALGFDPLYHTPIHNNTIQYYALIMLNALFPKYTYSNEPQPDQEMTLGSISYSRVTTTLTPIICLSVKTTQMESQGTGSFVAELSSFTQDYNHEAHPHQCVDQKSIPFMVCPIFYMATIHFAYPLSFSGYFSLFQLLATMDKAAGNTLVFIFSGDTIISLRQSQE